MKRVITICIVFILSTSVLAAPQVIQLNPLAGYSNIAVRSINDAGQVVGFCGSGANSQSFIWSQGAGMVAISGSGLQAQAINNNGMIVGYDATNGESVYWSSPTSTSQVITAAGNNGGIANNVNDNGQVVGRTGYTAANPRQAYVWDATNGITLISGTQEALDINNNGEAVGNQQFRWDPTNGLSLIGQTGNSWGIVSGINNNGTAVGHLGTTHGFMQTSDGTITALGALAGFDKSYAWAINDAEQIVGSLGVGSSQTDAAFIYENGVMTNLNDLLNAGSGWNLKTADEINNNGWIAGTGTFNGQSAGYVVVPEPATLVLLGLGGLTLLRRRK